MCLFVLGLVTRRGANLQRRRILNIFYDVFDLIEGFKHSEFSHFAL